MFRFAVLRHPEHAALIARVLAIPPKRTDRPLVTFLTDPEVDALLAAPDRSRWIGRRDHALLLVVIQTGLRVSELIGLRARDVSLGRGPHLRCQGKSRKERAPPRSPAKPSPCCAPGSTNSSASPPIRYFPQATAAT
jgi:integrase/recombinase XerD